jgi:hypothetical protein
MIGKATTGGNISGLLNYCYYENAKLKKEKNVRGEYIFSQNVQILLTDGRLNLSAISHNFQILHGLIRTVHSHFGINVFLSPKRKTHQMSY